MATREFQPPQKKKRWTTEALSTTIKRGYALRLSLQFSAGTHRLFRHHTRASRRHLRQHEKRANTVRDSARDSDAAGQTDALTARIPALRPQACRARIGPRRLTRRRPKILLRREPPSSTRA